MVELDVWQYYQTQNPGHVQVLGVDTWNGTPPQVFNFKNITGATYPVLLLGASATGGNVSTLYGTYDNYVVIDMRDMTVAYHAALSWPHGSRYHLNEIRDAVDAILLETVAVGDGPGSTLREFQIKTSPNPFRGPLRVELNNPGGEPEEGRISLLDVRGRRVAILFQGAVAPGQNRFEWSAAQSDERLAAGIYVVQATVGSRRVQQRVIYLP